MHVFALHISKVQLSDSVYLLQLDKMDASARHKAEMAQKIAQELLKSSSHRLASTPQSMPALNTEQSNLVRAAQQKAAEIAVQVPDPFLSFPF